MKLFLKEFNRYESLQCRYSGKLIRTEVFYTEMRWTGTRWMKKWSVKASVAAQMVAAGEAQYVTWSELKALDMQEA